LWQPDGTIYNFADEPTYGNVTDVLVGADGLLWVNSQAGDNVIAKGAIQRLDDQGTTALADDTWGQLPLPYAGNLYLPFSSLERTPKGDLWVAVNLSHLFARWHGDTWIEYQLPPLADTRQIVDIFAPDENHTWFAFTEPLVGDVRSQGIVALDDRGTPTDLSDDVWTEYPLVTPDGTGGGGGC